jgi:hypothetical protein
LRLDDLLRTVEIELALMTKPVNYRLETLFEQVIRSVK